jgi:hypothetical protein
MILVAASEDDVAALAVYARSPRVSMSIRIRRRR